jgi:hypothetical protein
MMHTEDDENFNRIKAERMNESVKTLTNNALAHTCAARKTSKLAIKET